MTRGTNIEHTRAYNRRVIMQILHRRGRATRTELASDTSLSLQAVSNIVQELEAEGFVVSHGRRASGRGQPPVEYAVEPSGAYSVGLSVDSDHVWGQLVDATGTVVSERRLTTESSRPTPTLRLLADLAKELRSELRGPSAARLIGVALAVPAVVEEAGGTIMRMVRLEEWEGNRVGDALSKSIGMPVRVVNDAVLAALGERWFGNAKDIQTFSYVLFALGVGSSLMLGGEPYGGPWGHRGRLGHIPVEPGGLPCPSCGGSGCLSLYTSLLALREQLAQKGVQIVDIEELASLHAQRNPELLAWLDSAAHYLARGLVVLENLLAPEVILFGGRMPRVVLADLVRQAGERYQRRRAPLHAQPARLLMGSHGPDAVTLGAAALPHYLASAASYHLVQQA